MATRQASGSREGAGGIGRGTAATDQPSQDGRRRALPASLFPEKSRPSPAPGRPSARLQGGSAATPTPRPIPAQRSLPSASPIGCQLPGRGCQRRVGRGRGSVGKGVERSRENVRMGLGGPALRDAHWLELRGRRCPLDETRCQSGERVGFTVSGRGKSRLRPSTLSACLRPPGWREAPPLLRGALLWNVYIGAAAAAAAALAKPRSARASWLACKRRKATGPVQPRWQGRRRTTTTTRSQSLQCEARSVAKQ